MKKIFKGVGFVILSFAMFYLVMNVDKWYNKHEIKSPKNLVVVEPKPEFAPSHEDTMKRMIRPEWVEKEAIEKSKQDMIKHEIKRVPDPLNLRYGIKDVKWNGKTLKAKVAKSLTGKIVRLNIGYMSFDSMADMNGNVTIDTNWTPPNGKITFGVLADNGKYLSSIAIPEPTLK